MENQQQKSVLIFDQWVLLSKCTIQKKIQQEMGYIDSFNLGYDFVQAKISNLTSQFSSYFWSSGPTEECQSKTFDIQAFKKEKTNELFTFLGAVTVPQTLYCSLDDSLVMENIKVPKILMAYFLTQKPEEESIIYDHVQTCINKDEELTPTTKNLFNTIIKFVFQSENITQLITIRPEVIELLKELKNNNHTCIFTGNLPSYTYDDILLKNYEDIDAELHEHSIFNHRDALISIFDINKNEHINPTTVFISGQMGHLTTNEQLFKKIVALYGSQSKYIAVNEHEKNLETGKKYNILGVCFEDAQQLRKQLQQLGVLKK